MTPQQLDDMLSASYKSAFQDDADTHDLGRVAKSVKAFVGKVSSHEGAEFPRLEHRPQQLNLCVSYVEEKMTTGKCHFSCSSAEDHEDVQFDPNGFLQTMQKMFGK